VTRTSVLNLSGLADNGVTAVWDGEPASAVTALCESVSGHPSLSLVVGGKATDDHRIGGLVKGRVLFDGLGAGDEAALFLDGGTDKRVTGNTTASEVLSN